MYALLIVAVVSIGASMMLTPFVRDLATRYGWLDHPDSKRKTHLKPVPRVGGIPLFAAYIAAFAVLLLLHLRAGDLIRSNLVLVWKIFPAGALVFAVGLLDDIFDLRPWQKIVGELLASLIVFAAGVRLSEIAGFHIGVWWSLPITVLWLVGTCNAFNLIDGVDGLSAGIGFFATITTVIAALLNSNVPLALATAPLAGALLGFLRFNSNPATIYLGDSGSLLIGFLLGCYSIIWSGKSATVLGMTAPMMVLAVPLLDTALAVVRRYLRNKPVFGADRGHIHHKLLARGFTPRRVVYMIYGFCGIGACLSLLQNAFHDRFGALIILVFIGVVCLAIRYLGYAEFDVARRIVFGVEIRRRLNAELELDELRENLNAAISADECWDVLDSAFAEFGFGEARMKFCGRTYVSEASAQQISRSWTLRIDISDTEYLNLCCRPGAEMPTIVARFAETVGSVLRSKTLQLRRIHEVSSHEILTHSVQNEEEAVKLAG